MGRNRESKRSDGVIGYGFNDGRLVTWVVVLLCAIPLVGFRLASIGRLKLARIVAWGFVSVCVVIVERMSEAEPQGTRMLLIIVALLWSMKSVVYIESRHYGNDTLTFGQWICFCVGWFGMRSELFQRLPSNQLSDWQQYCVRGLIRVTLGMVFVGVAWAMAHIGAKPNLYDELWRLWFTTACLLTGLSLIVHFGLFNLVAGIWRFFGVKCLALFRAPLLSESLSDFWGYRWNRAFSEMTAIAVFRPLRQRGKRDEQSTFVATVGAFLFSGLLHELAISVPVHAGFGQPMLYFAIQAVGMTIEKRVAFLKSKLIGRAWSAGWVLIPMPILFHQPFLAGCVWPIVGLA